MHKSMHVCVLFYVALSFRLPICFRFRYMCFVFISFYCFVCSLLVLNSIYKPFQYSHTSVMSICFFSRSRLSRIAYVSDEYTLEWFNKLIVKICALFLSYNNVLLIRPMF